MIEFNELYQVLLTKIQIEILIASTQSDIDLLYKMIAISDVEIPKLVDSKMQYLEIQRILYETIKED